MKYLTLALLTFLSVVATSCLFPEDEFVMVDPGTPPPPPDTTDMGGGGGMGPDTTGTGGGGMDQDTTDMGGGGGGMDPDTTDTGGGGDMGGGSNPDDLEGEWRAVYFNVVAEISITGGSFNATTISDIRSTEMDYRLTLMDGAFTAEGSYSYDVNATSDSPGFPPVNSNETIEDVNGSGEYIATADSLTISGQLFTLTYEGVPEEFLGSGPQTVGYFFRNDTLFFDNSSATTTPPAGGFDVRSVSTGGSAWVRN